MNRNRTARSASRRPHNMGEAVGGRLKETGKRKERPSGAVGRGAFISRQTGNGDRGRLAPSIWTSFSDVQVPYNGTAPPYVT